MPLGVAPGASVVERARVGPLGSLETIEAKGTAVGFVDKRVILILGVDDVLAITVPLAVVEGEGTVPEVDDVLVGPECELALEEVARA